VPSRTLPSSGSPFTSIEVNLRARSNVGSHHRTDRMARFAARTGNAVRVDCGDGLCGFTAAGSGSAVDSACRPCQASVRALR
jgi:hypothetical protein